MRVINRKLRSDDEPAPWIRGERTKTLAEEFVQIELKQSQQIMGLFKRYGPSVSPVSVLGRRHRPEPL